MGPGRSRVGNDQLRRRRLFPQCEQRDEQCSRDQGTERQTQHTAREKSPTTVPAALTATIVSQ